jgi:hypothetical protein
MMKSCVSVQRRVRPGRAGWDSGSEDEGSKSAKNVYDVIAITAEERRRSGEHPASYQPQKIGWGGNNSGGGAAYHNEVCCMSIMLGSRLTQHTIIPYPYSFVFIIYHNTIPNILISYFRVQQC